MKYANELEKQIDVLFEHIARLDADNKSLVGTVHAQGNGLRKAQDAILVHINLINHTRRHAGLKTGSSSANARSGNQTELQQ